MRGPSPKQWAAGLAAAAFATALALLGRHPDLVSEVRSWGAETVTVDCDPGTGPCVATFADGAAVTLGIGGAAVVAGPPLPWIVESSAGELVFMELRGLSMSMGLTRIPLAPEGEGRWSARASLPVCTSTEMRWRADVVVDSGARRRVARFDFTSRGRGSAGPR
jgi:hypothetical protein